MLASLFLEGFEDDGYERLDLYLWYTFDIFYKKIYHIVLSSFKNIKYSLKNFHLKIIWFEMCFKSWLLP